MSVRLHPIGCDCPECAPQPQLHWGLELLIAVLVLLGSIALVGVGLWRLGR